MSEFSIACPKCGSINKARTGIFAKRSIVCASCGEEINVKSSRMAARICSDCGSVVVCDQAKLDEAVCPACGHKLTLQDPLAASRRAFVDCPQCACSVEVGTSEREAVCPICGASIDVQREIGRRKIGEGGKELLLKYEGSSIAWKHPIEDFPIGSEIIVHESQRAVLFVDGVASGPLSPGRYGLREEELPFLRKLASRIIDGRPTFHAEVYFISMTAQMALKWGTDSRVGFIDPATGIPLDIGLSGEMTIAPSDPMRLLTTLVGTSGGIDWEEGKGFAKSLQSAFRAPIASAVKSCVATCIKEQRINVLEIDRESDRLAEAMKARISEVMKEYGLDVRQFYITAYSLPEDNPDFKRMKSQMSRSYLGVREEQINADIALAEQRRRIIQSQTEAQLKVIEAQSIAEARKLTGLAEAEAMRAQGLNGRDVLEADVQKAFAESLGSRSGISIGNSDPIADAAADILRGVSGREAPSGAWDCSCGRKGIESAFCPDCGAGRPSSGAWDCECGRKGLTTSFCQDCGRRRP